MQYGNNLRKTVLQREKKKIWFSKSLFPKGTSGKRGVVLYSGQYGNTQARVAHDKITRGARNTWEMESRKQWQESRVECPLMEFMDTPAGDRNIYIYIYIH